ncbi:hypothetical protein CL6EHI_044800 [Entamoeba histolytica]|uniref:Uncharacterized protein n=3 Tax=Entamoeba histolytica TaxID=5759 RepID=C4LT99_ENTH1|nr:hypothetical protein EHI_044800 [Entamoeba histolytica HM-1:IMSS]EAL51832.2 hypothetical protein EHI_044800 [Entamoeba histolytica HM-1:IMSS]GAT91777.1 hypothetical protein CL6EHI_044800 [Entamoeba histolytica]|eukprot:XP_657216.2 hypothetical protein EHI_044800 [Entamoeba histolytica HM-1:IMSS]
MITRKIECPCKNVSISVIRNEENIKNPFECENVKEIINGTITSKYNFLIQTRNNENWTILKCLHCKCDICASERDDPKTIIIFKYNENVLKDGRFSQTYGIVLKHHSIEEGFVGDEERREIAKIRQRKIDELYKEKERKIAEYVKKIEERYESDKEVVEEEEKDMLCACSVEETFVEQQEEESYFNLDVENPFGEVPIKEDGTFVGVTAKQSIDKRTPRRLSNQVIDIKKATDKVEFIGLMGLTQKKADSIRISRSLTTEGKDEEEEGINDNFPSTFQEYTLTRKETNEVPMSSSHMSCKSYRLLF